jgi:hypothetical protein
MFKEGNLVRKITEEGDAQVERVVIDEDEDEGTINIDNGVSTTWVDAEDYELVADSAKEQEVNKVVPLVPSRTSEEIHEDIQRMMVQLTQYYQASGLGNSLTMTFEATVYPSDLTLTLKCKASLGYGTEVTTRDLNKSVKIAVDRSRENKAFEPIEISFEGKQTDE